MTNANTRYKPAGVSQSDFGGTGLLQMPTARMAETGEFSVNYRDNDQYRRYSVSLQLLDWLETTFATPISELVLIVITPDSAAIKL
ncbi:YjbH domain-containing protein [Brenneria goodwinii]|uniref:Putative outer membrane lipoprotein YmcA n=1 Tax=Brenneria goodwinii TaxID=1109412 RepID=A0A0G4K302_9GAMM|nr:YjbH domain-containing protein [Brenneria goodwinii]CPR21744.1 Putative outer membrane lipoprotein YmcA [Brenneria goodwinii]